jgi:tetratricopeptide (TPR) repeat protein
VNNLKIFLILLISISIFASTKELDSLLKAEVFAQNLVDAGEYKKAKVFLEEAKVLYPKSETLWMFSATVAYELKDFDEAKKNFIKTLEINPKNEQASHFKELIEKQESASKNKDLEDLFSYLNDKGLDFISIFLAFLGGEIIARKFSKCNTVEARNLVKQYSRKDELSNSCTSRISFALKNYISGKYFFSFCAFLQLIIIGLIASSIMIFILLSELLVDVTIFSSMSLSHLSTTELQTYILNVFICSVFFTIIVQFFMYLSYLKESSNKVDLELSQYLEELSSNNRLDKLYCVIEELKELKISKEEILNPLLSDDCKDKLVYIYDEIIKKN